MLIDRGMHAGETLGYIDAKIFCERHAYHGVACKNLMTQANGFDLAMPINRITNADHGIREVDEPCLRASLFHIMRDLHNRTNIARGVGKAAGSAVFSIRLTYAVLDGNLKILLP